MKFENKIISTRRLASNDFIYLASYDATYGMIIFFSFFVYVYVCVWLIQILVFDNNQVRGTSCVLRIYYKEDECECVERMKKKTNSNRY